MPFNSAIRDAMSVSGNKSASGFRDAVEGEGVWTAQPGDDVQDLVPNLIRVIAYGGKLFFRDDADTTTAHDGVACIVTSGGERFKVTDFGNGPLVRRYSVLSITDTPPGSPTVGDTYIVDVGGTGAWSSKDGKVAHRTSAGWVYITPKLYDEAHVDAVSSIYHFNASSAWVAGVPALSLADESVPFTKLMHGLGFAIENQTTNTPPGSPSDKVAYIIGPSPTGAWSGHAFKIAYYINAAWLIVAPQVGWKAYDKAVKADVVYSATGWVSLVSGYSVVADSGAPAGNVRCAYSTPGFTFSGSMTYTGAYEVITLSYTPRKTGAVIEVEFLSGLVTYDPVGTPTFSYAVGFFVDSQATTTDWVSGKSMSNSVDASNPHGMRALFRWTATDTSAHTFRICSVSNGFDFTHRHQKNQLIVRERA